MKSNETSVVGGVQEYHSFIGDNKNIRSEQNVLVIDHASDQSLPALNSTNRSVLDLFRSKNSPEPHMRMMKNLKLKKNSLYQFDKSRPTQKSGHRRSTTSENQALVPAVENDHYQLNQLSQYQELKNALKTNIKQHRGVLNTKGLQKSENITASVDNIRITIESKHTPVNKILLSNPSKSSLFKVTDQRSQKATLDMPKMNMKSPNSIDTFNKKYTINRRSQNRSCQDQIGKQSLSPDRMRMGKSKKKSINKELNSYYKPYTLRDYKSNFQTNNVKFTNLGGLGPNKDEKWEQAASSLQKRRYFDSMVRKQNGQNSSDRLIKMLIKRK